MHNSQTSRQSTTKQNRISNGMHGRRGDEYHVVHLSHDKHVFHRDVEYILNSFDHP